MKKIITVQQYRSAVRVAQACDPFITKKNSIKAKIDKLQEEYDFYDGQVAAMDAGIRKVIGFPVEMLIKKVIIPGTDSNGKATKTTKYVSTDIVTYDEEQKKYIITTPDEEAADNAPVAGDPVEPADAVDGDNALNW